MLNLSSTPTIHVTLNIISFILTTIGILVSLTMLIGVLLRKRTLNNVRLLLCTNNYILVFLLGIFLLIDNVNILRGDFGITMINEDTLGCRIHAYILFSVILAVYLAYVLQAVYCLCRIVYPTTLWLIDARTYLIIIPILWTTAFILVSPLFIRHGQKLIPDEHICRIPKDDIFSIAYSTSIVYGIPFHILVLVYFQVHRFLRRQSTSAIEAVTSKRRRRQRDLLVFRRIIITVTLLGSYGIPNASMLIILAITNELVAAFYRILQLSFSAIVFTSSLALFYTNSQLRKKKKESSGEH